MKVRIPFYIHLSQPVNPENPIAGFSQQGPPWGAGYKTYRSEVVVDVPEIEKIPAVEAEEVSGGGNDAE
jgi:hypothetical protein